MFGSFPTILQEQVLSNAIVDGELNKMAIEDFFQLPLTMQEEMLGNLEVQRCPRHRQMPDKVTCRVEQNPEREIHSPVGNDNCHEYVVHFPGGGFSPSLEFIGLPCRYTKAIPW